MRWVKVRSDSFRRTLARDTSWGLGPRLPAMAKVTGAVSCQWRRSSANFSESGILPWRSSRTTKSLGFILSRTRFPSVSFTLAASAGRSVRVLGSSLTSSRVTLSNKERRFRYSFSRARSALSLFFPTQSRRIKERPPWGTGW